MPKAAASLAPDHRRRRAAPGRLADREIPAGNASEARFPKVRVDWNYFLYMCLFTLAKRNLFLLYCSATIEFPTPGAKGQRCIFSTSKPTGTDSFGFSLPLARQSRNSHACAQA